ncbi:MAG: GtrA family protein [Candidatus Dormibacteraeota bacterium]|nr:GtrA family protein [Candidatus Dormibacteraeota bacterium]
MSAEELPQELTWIAAMARPPAPEQGVRPLGTPVRPRASYVAPSHLARVRGWGEGRLVRGLQFGLVGLAGLAVNQAVLAGLVSLAHWNYLLAAVVSSQGSTVTTFIINELWVFRRAALDPGARALPVRFLVFDALNTTSLALRLPVLFGLTSGLGVNYLVSNFIAVIVFLLLRFAVADGWIWRRPALSDPTVSTGG